MSAPMPTLEGLDLLYDYLPIFSMLVGKIIGRGSGFAGLVDYMRRKGTREKVAEADIRTLNVSSVDRAAAEMRHVVNDFDQPTTKPMLHFSVNASKTDLARGIGPSDLLDMGQAVAERLGLGRHQGVLAVHEAQHVHGAINLVNPVTGRVANLWQSKARLERVIADIARERGLDIIAGKHNGGLPRDAAADRVATIHRAPERGSDSERKVGIESAYSRARADQQLVAGLKAASSWDELRRAAEARGWSVVRFSDGRRDGLVLQSRADPSARVALSKVAGGDAGYSKLVRRFGAYLEGDVGQVDRADPAPRAAAKPSRQPAEPAHGADRPQPLIDPLEAAARWADRRTIAQARRRWEKSDRKESWSKARAQAMNADREGRRDGLAAYKRDVELGQPTPGLDPRVARKAQQQGWARPSDVDRLAKIETARATSRADRYARAASLTLRPPPRSSRSYKVGWTIGDVAGRGVLIAMKGVQKAPALAKNALGKAKMVASVVLGLMSMAADADRQDQRQLQQIHGSGRAR